MGSIKAKSLCGLLLMVSIVFCMVVVAAIPGRGQVRWGIGAKLIGEVPMLTGSVEWNNIKTDVSTYYRAITDGSLTFLMVEGKYLLFEPYRSIRPYAGISGASISASYGISNATITGGGLIAGVNWKPSPSFGFEFGGGFLTFTDMTIGSYTIPVNMGGTTFEIGAYWRF